MRRRPGRQSEPEAMAGKAGQIAVVVVMSGLGIGVNVHLLLEEGVPEANGLAVVQGEVLIGALGFSHVKGLQIFLGRFAAGPELVPVDEHVTVGGGVSLFLIILKFLAADGNMVQHEVCHQVVFFRQMVNVLPAAKGWIHCVVVDNSEAPVAGGGKERQHMDAAKDPRKVLVQNVGKSLQVFPHAVRIGDEHTLVFNVFHDALLCLKVMVLEFTIKIVIFLL